MIWTPSLLGAAKSLLLHCSASRQAIGCVLTRRMSLATWFFTNRIKEVVKSSLKQTSLLPNYLLL